MSKVVILDLASQQMQKQNNSYKRKIEVLDKSQIRNSLEALGFNKIEFPVLNGNKNFQIRGENNKKEFIVLECDQNDTWWFETNVTSHSEDLYYEFLDILNFFTIYRFLRAKALPYKINISPKNKMVEVMT